MINTTLASITILQIEITKLLHCIIFGKWMMYSNFETYLNASNFDVERLRRVDVGHQVDSGAIANRSHVRRLQESIRIFVLNKVNKG